MKAQKLIARKSEKKILKKALESADSELLAIIGRRRVGKTFLVKSVYKNKLDFEITGIQNANLTVQLQNFQFQFLNFSGQKIPLPKNWLEAFQQIIRHLKNKPSRKKKIVFFDELPWLANAKSGFLQGFSFFWNSWAVNQNIVVIICGSAASWMIQKVVNDKGGLHNRITKLIELQPFNLSETQLFLKSRNVKLDFYQIAILYMAMGGIPHYLKEIQPGKSAAQNIDEICFAKNALLKNEFQRLYPALFSNSEKHISIIRALAKKRMGLTLLEIIENSKTSNGGSTKRILEELEYSNFISKYYPLNKKKKELIYRLTDEYSLFYIKFIEQQKQAKEGVWQQLQQKQTFKIWSGYAFENLCMKHIAEIKKKLGILGVYSELSSFYKKGTKQSPGVQIDFLLNRSDHVIDLFEVKFHNVPFKISKAYAKELNEKIITFKQSSKTNKQVFLNLISSFELIENEHSLNLIQNHFSLKELFK